MFKMLAVLALVLMVTSVQAQKTFHDPNVEVRSVSGTFHAIEISGGIDLYLSEGTEAVAVSARDSKFRDEIITEVKDGVLKIRYEWKNMSRLKNNSNKALKAYVSYKMLDQLTASGGSDVHVAEVINGGDLRLTISGGSDFSGKVALKGLSISASGGSDVMINGSALELNIDVSGGSDVSGYELISDTCTIDASGGSDVTITVNKEISAEASGASDISWKGSGAVKKARASGAGSVSHRS